MIRIFYNSLIRTIGLLHIFPTLVTSKELLQSLMKKLHPVSVGIELIRIGAENDGGYLVPDDLEDISTCFSPGVSDNSKFELQCANRGIDVILADYSVDGPAEKHEKFKFIKKYVGATTSDKFININDWINSFSDESKFDYLLQMDIEGYEYESILCLERDLLKKFRIIIVEFHHLEKLWSKPFYKLASVAFEKILETHVCVHIHPNNCVKTLKYRGLSIPGVMEFTFIRKDRIKELSYINSFPNKLDAKNTSKNQLILPKCWYNN